MPYIKQKLRQDVRQSGPISPGELNFAITELLVKYHMAIGGVDYNTINECLGALEGAKLEYYRRIAVPYEEVKRKENGDVYGNYTR